MLLELVLRIFLSVLFTVTSTALHWDLYFLRLAHPLTVTVHCKGERRRNCYKTTPPSLWFTQKSTQKPQRTCTFMNSTKKSSTSGRTMLRPNFGRLCTEKAEKGRNFLKISFPPLFSLFLCKSKKYYTFPSQVDTNSKISFRPNAFKK